MVAESKVHTLDATAAIAIRNLLREYLLTRHKKRPKSVTKVVPIKVEWSLVICTWLVSVKSLNMTL